MTFARTPTQKNPDFPELSSSIVKHRRSFISTWAGQEGAGWEAHQESCIEAPGSTGQEAKSGTQGCRPIRTPSAVCCLPLSRIASIILNRPCCGGKGICAGCAKEHEAFIEVQNAKNAGKKDKKLLAFTCPFCREPKQTLEEQLRRTEARAAKNDHYALSQLGMTLIEGNDGAPKDEFRGLDCWIRAAELGSVEACNNIGVLCNSEVATMCCLSITKDSCYSQKLAL